MCKSGISDTKPAMSPKRSSLEPKLGLYYRVSIETRVYGLSIGDKFGDLG